MSVVGNLRISNKFLLTAPQDILGLYPNCPRRLHLNHLSKHLNHESVTIPESCFQDPVKSKVAIVTGGIKGVGYQIADKLLEARAEAVILADENLGDIEEATSELSKKYGESKILFQPIDITNKADMLKLFKCTKDKYNKLDIVINNARVTNDTQGSVDVKNNVSGLLQSTFLGFQEMSGEGGIILNMAPILEHEPINGLPIFNQTNHFLVGFTKNLSRNYFYTPSNVKIMAVCPCSSEAKEYPEQDKDVPFNVFIQNLTKKAVHGNGHSNYFGRFPCQSREAIARAILTILKEEENCLFRIPQDEYLWKIKTRRYEHKLDNFLSNIQSKIEKLMKKNSKPCNKKKMKKKSTKMTPQMRDPMKPKSRDMVPKKDPCAKFRKQKKKGKKNKKS